jgi:hypothetical protein
MVVANITQVALIPKLIDIKLITITDKIIKMILLVLLSSNLFLARSWLDFV